MVRYYRTAVAFVAAALIAGTALAAPAKAKTGSIAGTLQKVDGQTLTIQTQKGPETVMLTSSAKIHSGSKTLAASDLASQTGANVKVHYTESNGQKHAESVTVSSATTTASADTTTKKSTTKK
jgi:hypothetical protein